MTNENWVIDVLEDVRQFAKKNELVSLAAALNNAKIAYLIDKGSRIKRKSHEQDMPRWN